MVAVVIELMILVSGVLPHDSGKTTVAKYIIKELISRGFRVAASKPIAGHSAWHQLYSLLRSIELGVLVGADALELHRVCGVPRRLEVLNPLDTLQVPLDIEHFKSPKTYINCMSRFEETVGVARISKCLSDSEAESTYYIVKSNVIRTPGRVVDLIDRLLNSVSRNSKVLSVETGENLISILRKRGIELCDECLKMLLSRYEIVVVESFNDAAAPTRFSSMADIVFIVSPGKVMVVDGKRFSKAFNLVLNVELNLHPWGAWVTTSQILPLLRPMGIVDVEPIYGEKDKTEFASKLVDYVVKLHERTTM